MNILSSATTANFFLILISIMSVTSAVVMGIRTTNNQLKSERIDLLEGLVRDGQVAIKKSESRIIELNATMRRQQQEIDELKRINASLSDTTAIAKYMRDEVAKSTIIQKEFLTKIDLILDTVIKINKNPIIITPPIPT